MQKITGYMRKAIDEYSMLKDGDRVAVGVSGGKDSVALLIGLSMLRRFIGVDYEIVAVTVDPRFGGVETDFSAITALCDAHDIPHVIRRSDLAEIIFDIRKEKNPCSLCAKMRRGILHETAQQNRCNIIALGHHRDDAIETFVMNLFHEGRLGCFSPKSYLSRRDLTMIRPLLFAPEVDIIGAVRRAGLPIVKSACPVDGVTARQKAKLWLKSMQKDGHPDIALKIFGAMRRAHTSGF